MENADAEEVELEIETDDANGDAPAPEEEQGAEVKSDPAAEAFARIERQMAMMRRAVEHLAAERADIVIPDYEATLAEMTKQLGAISGSIDNIGDHPAMQVTPHSFGRRIEAAAEAARRGDQGRINDAQNEIRQAAQAMRTVTTHARTSAEQRRKVFQAVSGGLLGGILLWSFLPGTIARAVPENWHWPERMATGMLDEGSGWAAGSRLMQADSPEAWSALVQAADLLRDDRDAIDACRKSAASSRQQVRCTIKIRAAIEPPK